MCVLVLQYFELSLAITWNPCQTVLNLFAVILSFMLDIFIGIVIVVEFVR